MHMCHYHALPHMCRSPKVFYCANCWLPFPTTDELADHIQNRHSSSQMHSNPRTPDAEKPAKVPATASVGTLPTTQSARTTPLEKAAGEMPSPTPHGDVGTPALGKDSLIAAAKAANSSVHKAGALKCQHPSCEHLQGTQHFLPDRLVEYDIRRIALFK